MNDVPSITSTNSISMNLWKCSYLCELPCT